LQAHPKEATWQAGEDMQGTREVIKQGMVGEVHLEQEEEEEATVRGSGHSLRSYFIVQRFIVTTESTFLTSASQ
jgi:hypothetical protein